MPPREQFLFFISSFPKALHLTENDAILYMIKKYQRGAGDDKKNLGGACVAGVHCGLCQLSNHVSTPSSHPIATLCSYRSETVAFGIREVTLPSARSSKGGKLPPAVAHPPIKAPAGVLCCGGFTPANIARDSARVPAIR
ncbi:MAG: hypothetical protein LBU67_03950 [Oscillospiraceae bacterium]|jgi:hypothetical protein|nr:hypothetical protein [Oscillospiraceae bacterium]